MKGTVRFSLRILPGDGRDKFFLVREVVTANADF